MASPAAAPSSTPAPPSVPKSAGSGARSAKTSDADTLPTIALRGADTLRTQRGYLGASVISLFGVAVLELGDGSAMMRRAAIGAIGVAAANCARLVWQHRGGRPYGDLDTNLANILLAIAALASVGYVGVSSAAPLLLAVLVLATAMAEQKRGRRTFVVIAVGYAVLLLLAVSRVIPPFAPFVLHGEPHMLLAGLCMVEVILAVSYYLGRSARQATIDALERMQRAKAQVAQREALLEEAQQNLERIVKGGRTGRLSGHKVGTFQLADVIGRGAMGEVYRACSEAGEEVAVKVLNPSLVSEPTLIDRFFREARVSSGLNSPHIVSVLGSGSAPDGSPYLVMELLVGGTLSELLRQRSAPLDLLQVDKLVGEVALGLASAHEAGIVHRDIKPGNVFLVEAEEPIWKVLDFGVSKLLGSGATLTGDGVIGTPGYMPPEQAFGRDVDARADVFALGAVAYRALTGQPPFGGPDVISVLLCAAQRQPPRPSLLVEMPVDVERVLAIALAKDRNARFPTPRDLATALRKARAGELPSSLRRHAETILARAPWDASVPEPSQTAPEAGPESAATTRAP